MEAEKTPSSLGLWIQKTSVTGFTGAGYLEFNGNSTTSGPATSPLEYSFKISKAGLYRFHLHCARETVGDRTDVANDAYIRVEGDYTEGPNAGDNHSDQARLTFLTNNYKYFGGNHNQFVWATGARLDLGGHDNKREPVYNFKAGKTYKLVVSGRSKLFKMDRIVFRHSDTTVTTAQNKSLQESTIVTDSGTGQAPVANAGSDQLITLPDNVAYLTGSGTDADGTVASYAWTQVSGPGTAQFGGGATPDLTASNLVAGTYVFRLTVTDNLGNIATDDVSVSVMQENSAFATVDSFTLLNATSDQPIPGFDPIPNGAVINRTTLGTSAFNIRVNTTPNSDFGRVQANLTGATVRQQVENAFPWAVFGDTNGNFDVGALNNGAHTLTATPYSADGTGGNAGTPLTIQFTVIDVAGGNPIANAGSDQSIVLPTNSITLSGSGTDDGSITAYAWSQVSGPSTAILNGATSATLNATNLQAGVYVFRLTVTDNQSNTGFDEVSVSISTAGSGAVALSGELKQWHKVTLTLDGPTASESGSPNPFADYRMIVTFTHPASGITYSVPGYFAADGNAADTSANTGNKWRAHLSPDKTGTWNYTISFRSGTDVAINPSLTAGAAVTPYNGTAGSFNISASDKTGRDHRGKGRLEYVNKHHLRFAGNGEYFLKAGTDAPENLLGYDDFDDTPNVSSRRKSWTPHSGDYVAADAAAYTWSGGKGTELLGAIAYLASEKLNVFSFLTFSLDGDDDNVFPHLLKSTVAGYQSVGNDARWASASNGVHHDRFDVSKMDQWERIFAYGDKKGMYLHFKTQETENDKRMDGGDLGRERKLYYRELIARYGHHLALNWNLGEENRNSESQRKAFAQFFADNDPYRHNIVLHTYPGEKNQVYTPLLGASSKLTGLSLQGGQASFADVFGDTKDWVDKSAASGRPWVVAYDEPGDAQFALRPDSDPGNSHVDGRKNALWGNVMAGGAGTEFYFGYQFAHSDLTLQDFRSRDTWWDYCRYNLEFFKDNNVPFQDMSNDNSLSSASNTWCLAKPGETYVIYLKNGGTTNLNLSAASGTMSVRWFDPRNGGVLQKGSVTEVTGGVTVSIGNPPSAPAEDWAVLVTQAKRVAYIYGDISEDGDLPSGAKAPYDQMLINDTGTTGLSMFKTLVENQGLRIDQFYDQSTNMNAAFLNQFDVIIFGLHQKIWSSAEKSALDTWLRAGGGMLIYSDSAAGGKFNIVGAQNTVGQTAVNNLISQYGMEVTVDQANGVRAYRAGPDATHPIVAGRPVMEAEGVSPVAVDPNGGAIRLIPYENNPDFQVSGDAAIPHQQNLTITNPKFAALALATVGQGNVLAMFDRQPMWNDGPGSDIEKRDNTEILRRIVNFLADDVASSITATFIANPTSGELPLLVQFDGSGSNPSPGATITSYEWDFENDGTIDASGASTSHTYITGGTRIAKLTVTDSLGAIGSTTITITINEAPLPQTSFGNGGAPWPVPGRIQAENFDTGGPGIAYSDTTTANQGESYRMDEEVDIEVTEDSSGVYNVGWIATGEWLEYTVDIAETGTYRLNLRAASESAGGTVRLLVDGESATGNIALSSTGNWQKYSTFDVPVVSLTAGQRVIRLEVVAGGFNLNWIELIRTQTFTQFIDSYPSLTGSNALSDADPDGDGIKNALEQWLGGDPTTPDIGTNAPIRSSLDAGKFNFKFTFDSSVTGSSLIYETSGDLKTWAPQSILSSWITEEGDLRHVNATFDLEQDGSQFHRLRVE